MARVYTSNWDDYELIDAGNELKLERWGKYITIRPERNAYFSPVLNQKEWEAQAHFRFNELSNTTGAWEELKYGTPKTWQMGYNQLVFNVKLTQFKHIGLFPEQRTNWDFIQARLTENTRFLNLFGYTGGASIMAKKSGADVFHCDSVKQINAWAKENMERSGLADIHWIHDDALTFAQRECKRNRLYDGIIMDPPAFGIGAKNQRWKIEDKFQELLETSLSILSPTGFLIANTYSPRLTTPMLESIAHKVAGKRKIEISTLAIKSTTGKILEYGQLTRIG